MITTRVLIDPGHGIPHTGATGRIMNTREHIVALRVAVSLSAWLQAHGYQVCLTRVTDACLVSSDRSADLRARGVMAGRVQANCMLSIHCNSAPAPQANGYECFTLPGQDASDPFATELLRSYGAAFPFLHLRADTSDGDIDKETSLLVLKSAPQGVAKALFELAFLSNPAEEKFLANPANYPLIAAALGAGICNWGAKNRL